MAPPLGGPWQDAPFSRRAGESAPSPERRKALDAELGRELDAYVRLRGDRMVRTAFLLTGDLALAEDLVQTTLVSLVVSSRRLRQVENMDAYVRTAIVNAGRRSWRRTARELLVASPPEGSAPAESDRYAEYDEVVTALRALPPRQRAAVVLRYYDDLSEAETARILGCSVGTVKSQTARGLAALRAWLAGRGSAEDPQDGAVTGRPARDAHRSPR